MLKEIEIESEYYNMKLNKKNKCEVVAMNRDNQIKFKDGNLIGHVDQATYLGGILTKKVNPLVEIQNRIASCIPTFKKLGIFLKQNTIVIPNGN